MCGSTTQVLQLWELSVSFLSRFICLFFAFILTITLCACFIVAFLVSNILPSHTFRWLVISHEGSFVRSHPFPSTPNSAAAAGATCLGHGAACISHSHPHRANVPFRNSMQDEYTICTVYSRCLALRCSQLLCCSLLFLDGLSI